MEIHTATHVCWDALLRSSRAWKSLIRIGVCFTSKTLYWRPVHAPILSNMCAGLTAPLTTTRAFLSVLLILILGWEELTEDGAKIRHIFHRLFVWYLGRTPFYRLYNCISKFESKYKLRKYKLFLNVCRSQLKVLHTGWMWNCVDINKLFHFFHLPCSILIFYAQFWYASM